MNKPSSLALTQVADSGLRDWLRGRRGTLVLAGVAGVVALAFGWYSLGFAAIAPVFYLLPCAVMMAVCERDEPRRWPKQMWRGKQQRKWSGR